MYMTLNEIFGAKESYQLPDKIMKALLSEDAETYIKAVRDSGVTDLRDYYQSDAGDRKNLKQDFTPDCICDLVSRLMLPGDCLDMCSGTGSLGKAAFKNDHKIHGQEFSERTIPFNLLDAAISKTNEVLDEADCLRGTIAKSYCVENGSVKLIPSRETGTYKNVIMNPPYSMAFRDSEDFEFFGMHVPKSKADYGFVLQGLKHMENGGRLIAILPHGVLFRGQRESDIRRYLVNQHLVNAVIGLPDNMFLNTGIPVFLLVLEKSEDTLFIDASKEFTKDGKVNRMTEHHIQHVVDSFNRRKDEERYAHVADFSEMRGNDYNLNIPRYVDTYVPEPLPDIGSLLSDIFEIESEENKTKEVLYKMLGELTASPDDLQMIKKHRDLLKPKRKKEPHQLTLEEYLHDVSYKAN